MPESEQLDCEFWGRVLKKNRHGISMRKLRLYACAWSRSGWMALTDERCRHAVEVGERYADYSATDEQRQEAWEAARRAMSEAVAEQEFERAAAARDAACCVAMPKDRIIDCENRKAVWHQKQCMILHDILGNPFEPIASDPSWLTPQVVDAAQMIYDNRAFHQMPELGCLLEQAGCSNVEVLKHCRQPESHVRGCWVVDLILGKK